MMKNKLIRTFMLVAALLPAAASAAQKTFVMVPKGVHPYYEPCYEGSRRPPRSTASRSTRSIPRSST